MGNDKNEFIIVYGINHVAAGKATYSSFTIYGAEGWNGVGVVTDQDFSGTAEAYLPNDPNAKYLYVYKFARHCNGDPYCYEVPTSPGAYGIALDQPLYIGSAYAQQIMQHLFWPTDVEKSTSDNCR